MAKPIGPPNPGIAAVLGLVTGPIGLLYVARPGMAALAVLMSIGFALLHLVVLGRVQGAGSLLALVSATVCAIASGWFASRYPAGRVRPAYSRWPGLLAAIVALLAAKVAIALFWFQILTMHSGSMLPAIEPRSRMLVSTSVKSFARGDIVVFFPGLELLDDNPRVARLIGLPGDHVVYRDKRLTINGLAAEYSEQAEFVDTRRGARQPQFTERIGEIEYSILLDPERVDEPLEQGDFPYRDSCDFDLRGFDCRVPPRQHLILGDNRDRSGDSRLYGYAPAEYFVGKVVHAFR